MASTLQKLKEKITGDSSSTASGDVSSTATGAEPTVHQEAPVVKEHVHDHTQHVDKTERHQVHEHTKVNTVIQPIKDEQERGTQHHRVDEGVSVREHGTSGLDDQAEAELRRRRDEIAAQGATEHSESHSSRDARPDTHVHHRTTVIEQVQPVIEKDIHQGHLVEHDKKEVEIVHEPTKVGSTQTAPTVTIDEFNRQR